jgi:hypothetical protein
MLFIYSLLRNECCNCNLSTFDIITFYKLNNNLILIPKKQYLPQRSTADKAVHILENLEKHKRIGVQKVVK